MAKRTSPETAPRQVAAKRRSAPAATRTAKRQADQAGGRPTFRVLFTCVGRRVELLRAFRRAGEALNLPLELHGADVNRLAPAAHHVDRHHLVPTIASGEYVDALAAVCRKAKIDLVVPLIDPELPYLAAARTQFAERGTCVLISEPNVITICQDKLRTFEALRDAGIDTPRTWTWEDACQLPKHQFPYLLKPRTGSAGKGVYIINNADELETLGRREPGSIVQEFVKGTEHTLDVYTAFDGRPRCVVPRRRLEIRTGEVSKGLVVKDPAIMQVGADVADMLAGGRGIITVQCIVTARGRIRVIEMNPRFGGGAPLGIQAGADFPKWILQELIGTKPRINPTGFTDDLLMLRFDESVFVKGGSKLVAEADERRATAKARRPARS